MIQDYQKESELLKALAHPVRLQMVDGLLSHECNVNKIVDKLKLPQSTISQHLGILRSRGIVEMRKQGVKTCYRVASKKIAQLIALLEK